MKYQQSAQSLLLYLHKHGQSLAASSSISISSLSASCGVDMLYLPLCPNLIELELSEIQVWMQLGLSVSGPRGMLRPGSPLRKLWLRGCTVLDRIDEVAATLRQLPSLEHLSLSWLSGSIGMFSSPWHACLCTDVLQYLTKLTYLELVGMRLQHPAVSSLQPLKALILLAGLRVQCRVGYAQAKLTASMLPAPCQLTGLWLCNVDFMPDVLGCTTMLQQLHLERCSVQGGEAQLQEQLQDLKQLTQLSLEHNLL